MSKVLFWVANWSISRDEAARRLGGNVQDMADATHLNCRILEKSSIRKVAGYITGGGGIAWSPDDWAVFPNHTYSIVHIDQRPDPIFRGGGVKDLEQDAGTAADGAAWAHTAIGHGLVPTLYMSESWVPLVNNELRKLGLPSGVIIAYQWASPSSNPLTLLPGTNLTLLEANVDLSVTVPEWYPIPDHPHPAPLTHDQQLFNWAFSIGYQAGWRARG